VTHEHYVGFGAGAGSKVDGVLWFNTFDGAAYIACEAPRPALVLEVGERLRRLHWRYWALYGTRVPAARYLAHFQRTVDADFGWLLGALVTTGFARRDAHGWTVTERGAIWGHRLQALFSLSSIDTLWTRCQGEAWPREVALG
jgi:coproporphyrinogen III oxidase-like Fe-S oxidoreductase